MSDRRAKTCNQRNHQEGHTGQRGGSSHPYAEPAQDARDFVGGNAGGEIADCEDSLIEHKQEDYRFRRDAGRGSELGQIDDIDRPA